MIFAGLVPLSLVDYPGTLAATVFTAGCTLRCGYCQNPHLVVGPFGPPIAEEEILAFLGQRQGQLSGLCVTGGEPTLHAGLGDFLTRARGLGYRIKLDTSGVRPDVLTRLLRQGLIDYLAMDVKTLWSRYGEVGLPDPAPVIESAGIIRALAPDYEFRTTVAPGLVEHDDVRGIAEALSRSRRYALQQFEPRGPLLDRQWERRHPHDDRTLWAWAGEISKHFERPVQVRNTHEGGDARAEHGRQPRSKQRG